jgi:hypothetical protein
VAVLVLVALRSASGVPRLALALGSTLTLGLMLIRESMSVREFQQ